MSNFWGRFFTCFQGHKKILNFFWEYPSVRTKKLHKMFFLHFFYIFKRDSLWALLRICFVVLSLTLLSQNLYKLPKIYTHTSPKNSQRIFLKIPEEFLKNFQRIPKEFLKNSKKNPKIISWLWKCEYKSVPPRQPRFDPCLDFGFQPTLMRNNWSKKIVVEYWTLRAINIFNFRATLA